MRENEKKDKEEKKEKEEKKKDNEEEKKQKNEKKKEKEKKKNNKKNKNKGVQENNGHQGNKPGVLINKNSVCYMNALIQALASSDVMIKKFQKISERCPSNSNLSFLLLLLNDLNRGNVSIRSNSDFLQQLVTYMKLTKTSQQDAFDLLTTLIEHIEKEFTKEDKHRNLPLKIKILHEFQDKELLNTNETDQRVTKKSTIQNYLGLSLNLCGNYKNKSGVPLEFLIDKHFGYYKIDENENKLSRMSLFKKAPDVLLIHIQANKWDPTTSKLIKPEYNIKYEEQMTLFLHIVHSLEEANPDLEMDREYNTKVTYDLKAIIEHHGKISCGNYVTHRKWNNKWYLMNDENATSNEFNNKICPYIMIYERSSNQADSDPTDSDSTDSDSTDGNEIDSNPADNNRIDSDPADNNRIDRNRADNKPIVRDQTD